MSGQDSLPIVQIGGIGFFKLNVAHKKTIGFRTISLEQDVKNPGVVRVTAVFDAVLEEQDEPRT